MCPISISTPIPLSALRDCLRWSRPVDPHPADRILGTFSLTCSSSSKHILSWSPSVLDTGATLFQYLATATTAATTSATATTSTSATATAARGAAMRTTTRHKLLILCALHPPPPLGSYLAQLSRSFLHHTPVEPSAVQNDPKPCRRHGAHSHICSSNLIHHIRIHTSTHPGDGRGRWTRMCEGREGKVEEPRRWRVALPERNGWQGMARDGIPDVRTCRELEGHTDNYDRLDKTRQDSTRRARRWVGGGGAEGGGDAGVTRWERHFAVFLSEAFSV
ncbi:hypothetical protein BZA05DRAFT_199968 [Tricharina praecox]|uniref:uncharacterized protein n=1 Tax=Tricharina praecox TaxID=43433 RepID=UPI00221EF875|nr:uncharacterized protein BZA05DRAFT_199968 [Tricharina praecox]KAI5856407.1 hypothetical protein BZA05DRAFT_199968 [Tricharina praecox]